MEALLNPDYEGDFDYDEDGNPILPTDEEITQYYTQAYAADRRAFDDSFFDDDELAEFPRLYAVEAACSHCNVLLPRWYYTNTQWNKDDDRRRCQECVSNKQCSDRRKLVKCSNCLRSLSKMYYVNGNKEICKSCAPSKKEVKNRINLYSRGTSILYPDISLSEWRDIFYRRQRGEEVTMPDSETDDSVSESESVALPVSVPVPAVADGDLAAYFEALGIPPEQPYTAEEYGIEEDLSEDPALREEDVDGELPVIETIAINGGIYCRLHLRIQCHVCQVKFILTTVLVTTLV
jgi:hypothetical protein